MFSRDSLDKSAVAVFRMRELRFPIVSSSDESIVTESFTLGPGLLWSSSEVNSIGNYALNYAGCYGR